MNDVGSSGAGGECANRTGLIRVQRLDIAPGQQPCKESLAGASPPGLGHDGRGRDRHLAAHQEGAVAAPHPALAQVGGDERAGISGP
jgi:hypothetical protein